MAPVRKILTPKGRPSRPVSEIRDVIRRVAAQAEEALLAEKIYVKPSSSSKSVISTERAARKSTAAKTVKKPAHP